MELAKSFDGLGAEYNRPIYSSLADVPGDNQRPIRLRKFLELRGVPVAIVELGQGHRRRQQLRPALCVAKSASVVSESRSRSESAGLADR